MASVAMTVDTFVQDLKDTDTELSDFVSEHLTYYGEVLIHLLMADVLRFAVAAFSAGQLDRAARVLHLVDRSLSAGDDALVDVVRVSFVENVGHGDGETAEFLAIWPAALLSEYTRQS
jgi:hypothetical protein